MGEHLESEGVAEENCYDELLELVVQGREIVVSEQVLCANSKYFKQVFCDLNPNVDTFILKQHGSEEFCNEIGNGSSTTNGFHDDEDDWWEYEDDEEDENEDEEQEKENVVDPLSLISYATMRAIIDHLSTGEALGICEQNVRHLLTAADLLAIGAVESECLSFLRTRVTTANCVRRFVLADSKPAWAALALYLLRCVQARFTALRTHPQLYQHPDAGQFARILAGESLAVDSEEQESLGSSYCSPFCQAHAATCLRKLDHAVRVLEAALEWVSYDRPARAKDLPVVLSQVQWPLIKDVKMLRSTLRDSHVAASTKCVHMLNEAIRYHQLEYAEKLAYWRQKDETTGKRLRQKPSRWPKLLVSLSYADKAMECFDFETQAWSVLCEKPSATFGAEMCYVDGAIYTLGGVQSKRVDKYDVEAATWCEAPHLRQFRVAHGTVVVGGNIFVMGGSAKTSENFGPGLDEMEVFDTESADEQENPDEDVESPWVISSSMNVGRSYLASASLGGKIYVVGGCLSEDHSTCEAFDGQQWHKVPSTLCKRDSLGLAVFDGALFAVGGYNDYSNSYLRTVERYDPLEGKWRELPSAAMLMARRSPGVVVHKNKLYAIGGMGEREDLRSVEVLDLVAEDATWTKFLHPMKLVCGWVSCCLIEKPLRMMPGHSDAVTPSESSTSSSGRGKRPRKSRSGLTGGTTSPPERIKQRKESH